MAETATIWSNNRRVEDSWRIVVPDGRVAFFGTEHADRSLVIQSVVNNIFDLIIIMVKWSCYRPGVAQRVGRGIALLFHDRGTRRGGVASSTPRPHFTPGKEPVPFVQEAGWAPGPVWTGEKSRPHRDSIPDRPAHSQSVYRLSYPAHINHNVKCSLYANICTNK